MDKELGDECEAHSVPLTLWCSTDSALVCYRCLLFGDHKGHECLDEEETRLVGSLTTNNAMTLIYCDY